MNFSSRVPRSFAPNRLTRLLAEHPPAFDLTESNPTRVGFDYPPEILAALADPRALRYEPVPFGRWEAREAVAGYYGNAVSAERIILTASTSEAYGWIFKLLCEPGDNVLVPRPSYPLFECLAHLEGVRVSQYPLVERLGWAIDLAALESVIDSRTRAIVFVNPNNPTGSFLKREELDSLAEICGRHGVALISDEVFADYAYGSDPSRVQTTAAETRFPVFTLSGLSKLAGLPQMKLGWIVAPELSLPGLEWIADSYLPVSAPVQFAAPQWVASMPAVQSQIRRRVIENRAVLQSAISGTAGTLLPAEGGWSAIIELPRIRSEEEWMIELLRQGVALQPGFFFDCEREAFAVASLLPGAEVMKQAGNKIRLTLIRQLS